MTQTAKPASNAIMIVLAVIVAAAAGYWWGGRSVAMVPATAVALPTQPAAEAGKQPRKLLYYRNPMGLPDTSPTPKKDPMGMDYIAVYEGGENGDESADKTPGSAKQIRISTEKVQKLGVRVEPAAFRLLDKTVRATGRIEADERRLTTIAPKFEGYVERLHVNVTGQPVRKGQPLFEVYSPELVSAQREYALASQGVQAFKDAGGEAQSSMRQLAEASLLRLRNWDISEEQVKTLAKSGDARRTLTFRSPVSGVVTEKKALQGMRFMPGEALYQIADLSAVWVIADVFEQDIGLVKTGAKARIKIAAYPDQLFEGRISYVYPTLKTETRTIPVRIELANPGALLKPGMYAQVELPVGGKGRVLTVPDSAVIDSGTRQIVLIQLQEGRFEPREVKLGARSDSYIEVLEGVKESEQVVVAANFLIDAESNLQAVVSGMGGAGGNSESIVAPATKPTSAGHQAEGSVDSVDAKAGSVTLNHGPVASLKWPAMTMEFKVANPSLLDGLKPGLAVAFEFVERQPGEWVITSIKPLARETAETTPAGPHAGH